MFNQYGVMLVNPAKCPTVKKDLGQAFIDYLISPEGQKDDCRLQGQRPGVVLPGRQRPQRVKRAGEVSARPLTQLNSGLPSGRWPGLFY